MHPSATLQRNYVYIWAGRLLTTAPAISTAPHRHLAASVLIGLDKPFQLSVGRQTAIDAEVAVIAPDVIQHQDSGNAPMVVLHLDPDQPLYRRLAPVLGDRSCVTLPRSRFEGLLEPLRAAVFQPLDCAGAHSLFSEVLGRVRGDALESRPLDSRIALLTQRFRQQTPERLDPDAIAAELGLSRSRLFHLFKSEIGTTMSRFTLALRLQNAIRRWRVGMNLTTIAQDAGFYDLSHLLQAGRKFYGYVSPDLQSMYSEGKQLNVYDCSGCSA